jgi:hypothetical protein
MYIYKISAAGFSYFRRIKWKHKKQMVSKAMGLDFEKPADRCASRMFL